MTYNIKRFYDYGIELLGADETIKVRKTALIFTDSETIIIVCKSKNMAKKIFNQIYSDRESFNNITTFITSFKEIIYNGKGFKCYFVKASDFDNKSLQTEDVLLGCIRKPTVISINNKFKDNNEQFFPKNYYSPSDEDTASQTNSIFNSQVSLKGYITLKIIKEYSDAAGNSKIDYLLSKYKDINIDISSNLQNINFKEDKYKDHIKISFDSNINIINFYKPLEIKLLFPNFFSSEKIEVDFQNLKYVTLENIVLSNIEIDSESKCYPFDFTESSNKPSNYKIKERIQNFGNITKNSYISPEYKNYEFLMAEFPQTELKKDDEFDVPLYVSSQTQLKKNDESDVPLYVSSVRDSKITYYMFTVNTSPGIVIIKNGDKEKGYISPKHSIKVGDEYITMGVYQLMNIDTFINNFIGKIRFKVVSDLPKSGVPLQIKLDLEANGILYNNDLEIKQYSRLKNDKDGILKSYNYNVKIRALVKTKDGIIQADDNLHAKVYGTLDNKYKINELSSYELDVLKTSENNIELITNLIKYISRLSNYNLYITKIKEDTEDNLIITYNDDSELTISKKLSIKTFKDFIEYITDYPPDPNNSNHKVSYEIHDDERHVMTYNYSRDDINISYKFSYYNIFNMNNERLKKIIDFDNKIKKYDTDYDIKNRKKWARSLQRHCKKIKDTDYPSCKEKNTIENFTIPKSKKKIYSIICITSLVLLLCLFIHFRYVRYAK